MRKKIKPDQDICLLCSKRTKEDRITGIFKNARLMYVISKGAGTNIKPDPGLPDTICYPCVVNLNVYFDYQNRIRNNIKKLLLNYYIKIGDLKKIEKYKKQVLPVKLVLPLKPPTKNHPKPDRIEARNLFKMQNFIENNDSNGLIITNVRSEHNINLTDGKDVGSDGEEIETEDHLDTSFLLKPMFQTSENALDTESGGNIHVQNDQITAQRYMSQMLCQCQYCPKVYRKQHFLKKHMRKHFKERRSKSLIEIPRTFRCQKINDCHQTFETLAALKKHEKDHLKIVKCHFCAQEFSHLNDYRWHMICCEAKTKSMNKKENVRQTRSISRAKSMSNIDRKNNGESAYFTSAFDDEAESTDTSDIDSVYSEKMRRLNKWRINMNKINGLVLADKSTDVDNSETDCLSLFSDAESVSLLSKEFSSSSDNESYYSQHTEAKKRRKKHKEGRKKAKRRGEDYFSCSYGANCSFGCTSLARTMNHERTVHNALLLYYCKECIEWFSTRENLIRHRKRHRAFFQNCIKCNQLFDNNYDLEHHMMLHHEKSYSCYFCCMSFLKESELENHLKTTHENDRIEKHGIISRNGEKRRRSQNQNEFTGYKSKEMIQRSISNARQRPSYQCYRKKIGNVANPYTNAEKPAEYWVYGNEMAPRVISGKRSQSQLHAEDENVLDSGSYRSEVECDAPPTFFTDYSGSPVMFFKQENDNDLSEELTTTMKTNSNTLEHFNLFSIDCLAESHSSSGDSNSITRFSRHLSKRDLNSIKKRRITSLPIPIADKYIPSYDILFNTNNVRNIDMPSNDAPFRYPD